MIFEKDPENPVYNDEFKEELITIEDILKNFSEKHNVTLMYNGPKFPYELACIVNSETVKIPSHYERESKIDLSLHFNTKNSK
jgi:hypothetical protein